jgi:hypothetical protein
MGMKQLNCNPLVPARFRNKDWKKKQNIQIVSRSWWIKYWTRFITITIFQAKEKVIF